MNVKKKLFISFLAIFLVWGCSKDKTEDASPIEKKLPEVNPQIRAKQFAEKGGGILGDFSKNKGSTTYNFATSNIMWKATLNTLNFMPLQNVDYAGGVILTDWYTSESQNSKESIKIGVKFLSDKVSSTSIQVTSHKKVCDNTLSNCKIIKLSQSFNDEIKDKIMKDVITISIKEEKEKNTKK